MECKMNEVIERTGREWVVLLVGLWGVELGKIREFQ